MVLRTKHLCVRNGVRADVVLWVCVLSTHALFVVCVANTVCLKGRNVYVPENESNAQNALVLLCLNRKA